MTIELNLTEVILPMMLLSFIFITILIDMVKESKYQMKQMKRYRDMWDRRNQINPQ